MRFLACLLVLGVFVRHEAVYGISAATGYTPAATFRMLGGAWEAILCSVVMLLAFMLPKNIWRNLIVFAMAMGTIEGIQTPLCRILISDIKQVPATMNLCDYVVGWPLSYALLSLYLFAFFWSLRK